MMRNRTMSYQGAVDKRGYAVYCDPVSREEVGLLWPSEQQSVDTLFAKVFQTGSGEEGKDQGRRVEAAINKVATVKGWTGPFGRHAGGRPRRAARVTKLRKLKKSLGSKSWRRSGGLDDLRNVDYSSVERVNGLWTGYAEHVMKMFRKPEEGIVELDMHGARIEVTRSKNPNRIGLAGLVLKDQGDAFHIVSSDGRKTQVNKHEADFCIRIGKKRISIYGSEFVKLKKGMQKTAGKNGRKHA